MNLLRAPRDHPKRATRKRIKRDARQKQNPPPAERLEAEQDSSLSATSPTDDDSPKGSTPEVTLANLGGGDGI